MARIYTILPSVVVLSAAVVAIWAAPRAAQLWRASAEQDQVRTSASRLAGDNILTAVNEATRDVARTVAPSVVSVSTRMQRGDHSWTGGGSGWVWDEGGHIVTNAHVVDGAELIEIQTASDEIFTARLIGLDLHTDIALLRLDVDGLTPALRCSETPMQGDMVFAFGSPFGFRFSMSAGIVSGVGRSAGLPDIEYENFIQVDAAINPGNSGGPLTDVRGRVLGMNTAIATGRGNSLGQGQFAGIGLAIPMEMIENVIGQIIESGEVHAGFLGVSLLPARALAQQRQGNPLAECIKAHYSGEGAVVGLVSRSSPAEGVGLRLGDVIMRIDGIAVTDEEQATSLIASRRPGTITQLDIWRPREDGSGGDEVGVAVALMERAASVNREPLLELLREVGFARLETCTETTAASAEVGFRPGVLVADVTGGSSAAGRVDPGAIIVAVDGAPIRSLDELLTRIQRIIEKESFWRSRAPMLALTLCEPSGQTRVIEVSLPR